MKYLLLTIIVLNQLYSQTKATDISLLVNNTYSSKYTKLLAKILEKDISKKYSLNININIILFICSESVLFIHYIEVGKHISIRWRQLEY